MREEFFRFNWSKCSFRVLIFPSLELRILFILFKWLLPVIFFPASIEYDIPVFEKSGKGGTYPRRYGIPFGLQDYSDGLYRHPDCSRWGVFVSHLSPVQQGGRPFLGLGEPRFMGFARRSTLAPLNSPPVPAVAAASSPLTSKRFQDHPGGLEGAVTSNLVPTQLQLQPCRSWTSVLQVDVSRTLILWSLFVLASGDLILFDDCTISPARSNQLAAWKAAGPRSLWTCVPLLRCRYWTWTGGQTGPVWSGESRDQQGKSQPEWGSWCLWLFF